jgi:hypothetical protein
VEDSDFWVSFVAENSNKLQKLGLEWKISWAFNLFTLLNLEIFNSENVKNKEFVDTWANGTGYTSMSNDIDCFVICGASKYCFCVFVAMTNRIG